MSEKMNFSHRVRVHENRIRRIADLCDGMPSLEELARRAVDSLDPELIAAGKRILGIMASEDE